MTSPVRPATAADVTACAAMVNDWIDATAWHPRVHSREDVERFYRDTVWAERDVMVAGDPTKGFIAIDAENFVTALYASPPRNGTGRALMEAAQRTRDHLRLWTHVPNKAAQAFYGRMGFAELRRTDGDNEEGVPDILYRWCRA